MKRAAFLIPILVFAGLFVIFFWRLSDTGSGERPSPLIGKAAPDFALPSPLAGAAGLRRSDLAGRIVILNFFASWCAPCRAEHPLLKGLAESGDWVLAGIAFKDKPEDSAAFLRELGNPYAAIGADEEGRVGIDFGISGVPETFILDREGIIRYRLAQPLTPERIEEEILPLLKELAAQ